MQHGQTRSDCVELLLNKTSKVPSVKITLSVVIVEWNVSEPSH